MNMVNHTKSNKTSHTCLTIGLPSVRSGRSCTAMAWSMLVACSVRLPSSAVFRIYVPKAKTAAARTYNRKCSAQVMLETLSHNYGHAVDSHQECHATTNFATSPVQSHEHHTTWQNRTCARVSPSIQQAIA